MIDNSTVSSSLVVGLTTLDFVQQRLPRALRLHYFSKPSFKARRFNRNHHAFPMRGRKNESCLSELTRSAHFIVRSYALALISSA